MEQNLKKTVLRISLLSFSAILIAVVFVVFVFQRNSISNKVTDSSFPSNEFPLQEVQSSPGFYFLKCKLNDVLVREVKLGHLYGELFGICGYVTNGDTVKEIALLLGYVDKEKNTTFLFGQNFGKAKNAFKTESFQGLSQSAGYVAGKELNVVLTTNTNPGENEGVYGVNVIGEDISKLYQSQNFSKFAQDGSIENLPFLGEVNGYQIVFPISVQ